MRLAKTDRARAALHARDPAISVIERRVLILCDGNRSDGDVGTLLGADAAPAIARLLAAGYLQLPPSAQPASTRTEQGAEPRGALARFARPSAPAARPPAPAPAPAPTTATATATADASTTGVPGATKRSLLAARMYLIDMLALQRGVDTTVLQSALREARSADATLDAIADALARLQRATSPSYCERVRARLLEVLPIEQLDTWATIERGRGDRSSPGPSPMTPSPQLQPSA
ncbi:hypothetical protein [Cognatilysobacter tabacisoli]|uniref:hypothetical protein n=1 Tax=Cognatilysobacter tabacisoli TaxID=2315424 RepID=UPI000E6B3039|nr:hypothetical protein [Lysobacter tabacisoli]